MVNELPMLPEGIPTPDWKDERYGVALYHADCMDVLPELPKVDAMVTDPPYGIGHTTSHGATWAGTQIHGDADTSLRDSVLNLADYIGIPWACWGSYKVAAPPNFKAKVIWNKGPAFGAGDLKFPWKPSFEECWFSQGPWSGSSRDEGVWEGPCVVSWQKHKYGRVHPHQKPVWLFTRILTALPNSHTILDPFMGSGTTGVAAVHLKRAFIGIECERDYFDICVQRISKAIIDVQGGELFAGHTPAQLSIPEEPAEETP